MAATFATAAQRYWLGIYPLVGRELRHWSRRAAAIPDPTLRRDAVIALTAKRGHPEGAAAFATLAPPAHRTSLVRALVAWQVAYDYLDLVSERPGGASPANGRRLHQALVMALDPSAQEPNYYAFNPAQDDGGFLRALIATCREASSALPCFWMVSEPARRLARLIVTYQSLSCGVASETDRLADWAQGQAPVNPALRWWETAAATGSSLSVLALLAAAADPRTQADDIAALEETYFPWIGALHSLLDSLIDQAEDEQAAHHNLVSHYASEGENAQRLGLIAHRSRRLARGLPQGRGHVTILIGMASYYLSAPQAALPPVRCASDAVITALGSLMPPTLLLFRIRQRGKRKGARRGDLRPPGLHGEHSTTV